jgi:hypothetical protein
MSTPRRWFPALLITTVLCLVGFLAPGQQVVRTHAPAGSVAATPVEDATNYQLVPVNSMIDLLEALSGKHAIRDANLNGVPPISVNAQGLTKEETIRLITATLILNGVAVIPVDDHTMKIVTCGTNKNPRSEGLLVYTNAADLPDDDEIVTYYMALDHIDPSEAAGLFTQVAPVHVYGAYVPAPSAQGIILTENASIIRELIDLKKSIDVTREPNVRLPPPGPRGPGDSHPPGPPHDHPLLHLLGLIIALGVFVVAVAAGNVLAHRWMNRGKPSAP